MLINKHTYFQSLSIDYENVATVCLFICALLQLCVLLFMGNILYGCMAGILSIDYGTNNGDCDTKKEWSAFLYVFFMFFYSSYHINSLYPSIM